MSETALSVEERKSLEAKATKASGLKEETVAALPNELLGKIAGSKADPDDFDGDEINEWLSRR